MPCADFFPYSFHFSFILPFFISLLEALISLRTTTTFRQGWTNFLEISNWRLSQLSVEAFHFQLKFENNNGHFAWKAQCVTRVKLGNPPRVVLSRGSPFGSLKLVRTRWTTLLCVHFVTFSFWTLQLRLLTTCKCFWSRFIILLFLKLSIIEKHFVYWDIGCSSIECCVLNNQDAVAEMRTEEEGEFVNP
jgi:hypothetical protein